MSATKTGKYPRTEDRATTTDPNWGAPGPGTWELDTTHVSPNCSRLARDLLEFAAGAGFTVGLDLFGGPIATIEARFVNGHYYIRLVPLVGADKNLPVPPAPVLWLVARLHPTFRRRAKTAAQAMATRFWMQEYDTWEHDWKPDLVATNERFGAVDPSALDDRGLATHIGALHDHLRFSTALHFRLHVSDLGPIGLMLVRGRNHGLDGPELMEAMAGSSPATVAPAQSLERLRELVSAQAITPDSLDAVRAISDEAASLLDTYLETFGNRLTTGYDVQDRTLSELPQVVLAAVTERAGESAASRVAQLGNDAMERLLARVPVAERDSMRVVIEDARALYGLRDENGPLTYEWPMGIMRRAVLEAQRRLLDLGALAEPAGVFDLTAAEMCKLLSGATDPDPDEVQRRTAARRGWLTMEAPLHLGPDPVTPPTWVLPGALAEIMEAVLMVTDQIESTDVRQPLRGLGIGSEPYIGTARVVQTADEAFGRMQPGDVLVAPFTVPTYNSVLSIAGAVVVENGGLLCHAAVIAREFGIPGLVGATQATTDIPDGAMVEVDPVAGTVRVLQVT